MLSLFTTFLKMRSMTVGESGRMRESEMKKLLRAVSIFFVFGICCAAVAARKPHAVFVVGTSHYSPGKTMPLLAERLKADHGYRNRPTILSIILTGFRG
jgi:hypothetical protein